jgi:hypothetical protein
VPQRAEVSGGLPGYVSVRDEATIKLSERAGGQSISNDWKRGYTRRAKIDLVWKDIGKRLNE